jgi:hypothetical protein
MMLTVDVPQRVPVQVEMLPAGGWIASYVDERLRRRVCRTDPDAAKALAALKALADRAGVSFVIAADG